MSDDTFNQKKFDFIPLPEENDPAYLKALTHNCIAAYSLVLSDKTALDYNKVPDNFRTVILEDREYRRETRSIKARRMVDEIRELEYLANAAMRTDIGDDDDEDEDEIYDPRRPKSTKKEKPAGADKDAITMRFKAAQLRRELLNLSAGDDNSNEAVMLNAFFVSLGREEFMKLSITDVRDGDDTGAGAFSADTENPLPGMAAPVRETQSEEPLCMVHENGDVEEL
jgi:hypothetical protein